MTSPEAMDVLESLPGKWPFTEDDFRRDDETDDAVCASNYVIRRIEVYRVWRVLQLFYGMPRMVKHIDDAAVYALTLYFRELFETYE
jgi:hypothetical protein